MRRTIVVGALLVMAGAGCAGVRTLFNTGADQWANAPKCSTGACVVDITVASCNSIQKDPPVIRITGNRTAPLIFNLKGSGYHFDPTNGVVVNNGQSFTHDPGQSGPAKFVFAVRNQQYAYHSYVVNLLPDGGGAACRADPGVVTDPNCEGC